jgi:alcohol dehydrogenase class IV
LSFIRSVRSLIFKLNIPTSIKDAGVSKEDFEAALDIMAADALADATIATNPVPCTKEDIINLYRSAYNGRF